MTRRLCLAALIAAALLAACRPAPDPGAGGITQVATIDALLAGAYDGTVTLAELRQSGDFGIGTFHALDGEMILLDGVFYKVRGDGTVVEPPLSETTPFASVTHFRADVREELPAGLDLPALEARIDRLLPQANRFCAFRVRGEFRHVRVRSVPAQSKPYPPLVAVTRNQPMFTLQGVRGTLIGFRSPTFVKGVNVPGYHLHFLADDRRSGGHVLEFTAATSTLEADTLHDFLTIRLPAPGAAFEKVDLTPDRSGELEEAEKNPATRD